MKTTYVVGTADTKGEELKYVKDVLKMAGVDAQIVDLGPISQDTSVDVTAAKVATFHPRGADAVHKETDRGQAVTAMSVAFEAWVDAHVADIGVRATAGRAMGSR